MMKVAAKQARSYSSKEINIKQKNDSIINYLSDQNDHTISDKIRLSELTS